MSIHRGSDGRGVSPLATLQGLSAEFPRVVLVLATGDLVASFGFSLFFPILTIYLVERLGASAAQAGLVIAAYSVFGIVSGIVGGWVADRIGRRPVLIGSISCTAILVASMALATEAWHVGVIMLLLGSIDPAFLPAARAAVADTVNDAQRPRAFALLGVANALGWIAGPVIGAGLSTLGYPVLFGVSGLLVGTYSLIALRWLPETRPRDGSRAAEPGIVAPATLGSAPVGASQSMAGDILDHDAAMERRRLRVFGAFLPLIGVSHGITFLWVTTLPIHASAGLDLPTPVWGLMFGLNGLLIVLFQLRISAACERRSKPRVMAVALLLYAAGLGLVAFLSPGSAVAGLALTIALVTVGEMLLMPLVPSFVSELSPAQRRGTYQGIAMAAGGIGSAVGPPVAGQILDSGQGDMLWVGAAGILVLVGLCFVALGRWSDGLPPAA